MKKVKLNRSGRTQLVYVLLLEIQGEGKYLGDVSMLLRGMISPVISHAADLSPLAGTSSPWKCESNENTKSKPCISRSFKRVSENSQPDHLDNKMLKALLQCHGT